MVPAIETLQNYARALEIPMYQLFYDGDEPPKPPRIAKLKATAARGEAPEKTLAHSRNF